MSSLSTLSSPRYYEKVTKDSFKSTSFQSYRKTVNQTHFPSKLQVGRDREKKAVSSRVIFLLSGFVPLEEMSTSLLFLLSLSLLKKKKRYLILLGRDHHRFLW